MYRDHVIKSLIIIFLLFLDFFMPFLSLKLFYGPHFTYEYGFMFSKLIYYLKHGYFGYVYVSKTEHSAAMIGVYFYIAFFLLLAVLSVLLLIFLLTEKKKEDFISGASCKENTSPDCFDLDSLDDKKRIRKL